MSDHISETNVCVIGGAGFLGSHLVDHLIDDRQCNVLVLDNLISGARKNIHQDALFLWHDIREDELELSRILSDHEIKWVFNYAAEPYIPECFERPMHFFNINATAVLKVINACDRAGIKGLLQVSSAEIYGACNGKIGEDAPIEPHSTYGVSKAAADGLVQVRWREAQSRVVALRQFNCIGERETHDYVVPAIISRLDNMKATGNRVLRMGNNSTRDFQYAGDAVRMATELLEKGQWGQVYNMGSEDCIKIYELAQLIANDMRVPDIQIVTDPELVRPWEIWHLQSDNSKLYSLIDTRPAVSLKDAITLTVNYFYENGAKWDW